MEAGAMFRESTEAENSESIEFLLRKIAESKQNNVNSQ